MGDTLDVRGDTWGVLEGACGEEDGDGELMMVVVEDELA